MVVKPVTDQDRDTSADLDAPETDRGLQDLVERLAARTDMARKAPPGQRKRNRVAVLARTLETDIIPRLLLAHRNVAPRPTSTSAVAADPTSDDVSALTGLAMQADLPGALSYLEGLRARGIPLERLYLELLAPVARRLGVMWERGHLRLHGGHGGPVLPAPGGARVQPGLRRAHAARGARPPCAARSLARRTAQLRHSGACGAVLPRCRLGCVVGLRLERSDIIEAAQRIWFGVAGFSLACDDHIGDLAVLIRDVRRASRNAGIGILVGGPLFMENPDLVALVGADATAADGRQAHPAGRNHAGAARQGRMRRPAMNPLATKGSRQPSSAAAVSRCSIRYATTPGQATTKGRTSGEGLQHATEIAWQPRCGRGSDADQRGSGYRPHSRRAGRDPRCRLQQRRVVPGVRRPRRLARPELDHHGRQGQPRQGRGCSRAPAVRMAPAGATSTNSRPRALRSRSCIPPRRSARRAASSCSGATCGRCRACSSDWSRSSNRWSGIIPASARPRPATGCCSRCRPTPCWCWMARSRVTEANPAALTLFHKPMRRLIGHSLGRLRRDGAPPCSLLTRGRPNRRAHRRRARRLAGGRRDFPVSASLFRQERSFVPAGACRTDRDGSAVPATGRTRAARRSSRARLTASWSRIGTGAS